MRINILDKFTSELIAAGEVVEKPASVVKELCENSIDAGAKNISVEIEKGGVGLIRIQDDGDGIEKEDIPKAFLRHATSKLNSSEDLDAIATLGFRGEALASISSVAKVSLLTKTCNEEYASLYRIAGGEEISFETAAGPQGTNIEVRDLFYNTPARMKFLKKDVSEGNYVSDIVTKIALSHPEISVSFYREGKMSFSTPGDSKLESAVYSCLGSGFSKGLLPVEWNNGFYSVQGLVTGPLNARASRSMQFFFVNGRFVKNRTIMAALEQAFKGSVMGGKFPGCVLFISLPSELVDVNVHPAKTEVRFAKESDVFDTVYRGVKSAVNAGNSNYSELKLVADKKVDLTHNSNIIANKTIEENTLEVAEQQELTSLNKETILNNKFPEIKPVQANEINFSYEEKNICENAKTEDSEVTCEKNNTKSYNITNSIIRDATALNSTSLGYYTKNDFALDIMYDDEDLDLNKKENNENNIQKNVNENLNVNNDKNINIIGQIFKTYIIAEYDEKLCFIDKHAAHERILYENLISNRKNPDIQQLLVPETVNVSADEKNALLQNEDLLSKAGLEIADFGEGTVIIRGVPADINSSDIANVVLEIAEKLSKNIKDTNDEKTQWILHSVACRAAIKAGDNTNTHEMLSLAKDILENKVPPFCPHGRPVVVEISRKELEKQFGR